MTATIAPARAARSARPPRMPDPATDYARAVVAGKVVVGRLVRLACQRHLDDLIHGPDRGLVWDLAEANRVIDLIGEMPLPDGAPFVVQPSQAFITGSVFGWRYRNGQRRFRTAYVEEGKGNGKTPLAARVGIVGMAADGVIAAEVYTAGVTKDQSHYILRDAKITCQAAPAELRNLIEVGAFALSVPASHSYMKPVSSEARTLDQKRVHMALIDEIHEHRTHDVVEKMRAGTKGDDSALIFEITNSGYDRHSVCWQHHEYSRQVLEGIVENDSWFAFVAALDEGDDWTDEAVWPKANPLLDVTVTRRYLREQVQEALEMPAKQSLVKRLNFCIWTEASVGAVDMAQWDAGADHPTLTAGDRVYAGLDLSATTDLSALILLREAPDGWLDAVPFFWCPKEAIGIRSRRDHVPYDQWVDEGYIVATEGPTVDYDAIRRRLSGYYVEDGVVKHDNDCLADTFEIQEVGFDPWNATQLTTQLVGDGLPMIKVPQGFAYLSSATKDWLGRVTARKIRHGGNPVLRWMASNLVVLTDPAGNMRPDKDKSTERIDGQVAGITGLARLITHVDEVAHEPFIIMGAAR